MTCTLRDNQHTNTSWLSLLYNSLAKSKLSYEKYFLEMERSKMSVQVSKKYIYFVSVDVMTDVSSDADQIMSHVCHD